MMAARPQVFANPQPMARLVPDEPHARPVRDAYRDNPLRRMNSAKTCIYDQLFAMDGTAADAIDRTYDIVEQCVLRVYSKFYHKRDFDHLQMIREKGNGIAKLVYILGVITHDTALRVQFEQSANVEDKRKMDAFFLLLSIVFRSVYESNIREDTGQRIVNSALEILHRGWMCCDAEALENFCHWYSSPVSDNDYDLDDLRESAESMAKEAIAREAHRHK